MREIKFRAWDRRDGKIPRMFYNVQKTYDNFSEKVISGYSFGGLIYASENYAKDELYLMQYTGLKDKNGVEIYEGDIIKCDEGYNHFGPIEVVEWSNDEGVNLFRLIQFGFDSDECEILGNIYENPELMEKDK